MPHSNTPVVIWEGNSTLFDEDEEETFRSTKTYRVVWEPWNKRITFERKDGTDAMGQVRWVSVDKVPLKFLHDASELMAKPKA